MCATSLLPLRNRRAPSSPLAAASAWADADPYVAAGVYASVSVKPFRMVLP